MISGITMVFVPALTTFVISDLLGGGKILLIGNVIEQSFKQNSNWHVGSGLSLVLMVFIQNQSGRIGSISILAILFRQCLYEASSFSVYYSIPGDFKKRFQWRFIQHELSFIQNNLRLILLVPAV